MTLRQKILLLGLVAIVGISFAVWRQHAYQSTEYQTVGELVRNIETVAALSAVVHELQRERGLTVFALAGTQAPTTLTEEIARTDAAIAHLAKSGRMLPDFSTALARLRTTNHADRSTALGVRDDFSILLRSLIDEMARLAREPASALAKDDISAHVHLVAMKEYLGQTRATLAYWLAYPRDGRQAFESLVRINALLDEEQRRFEREASSAFREEFRVRFADAPVEATRQALQTTLRTGRLPAGLEALQWFEMSTATIDRLFDLEMLSLRQIEQMATQRQDALRAEIMRDLAALLVGALFVLMLTVSAVVSLLRALQRTLAGMEKIATTSDFSSRIPVDSADEIGRIARSFNALLEIAERLLHEKEQLAATDPLTGIGNRLRFAQKLDEEAQRKLRNHTPMALAIFDIDRFKQINDTLGHNAGDAVLKALVKLVSAEVRPSDFFARWGGEEFILLLRDDNCDAAFATAEKLRKLIAATPFPGVATLTCSFGVTAWQENDSAISLVSRADKALYEAKNSGRNRTRCSMRNQAACPGLATCMK